MKGYVLRWNPNISSWTYERHRELMNELHPEEYARMNWSIFDFENLEEGDFFILQQVGTESDGIAMVGTFLGEPYTSVSWKKKDGTNLFYADMKVDFMLDREIPKKKMPYEDPETFKEENFPLRAVDLEKIFPKLEWHKGHSGVLIPEEVLEPLVIEVAKIMFGLRDINWQIKFHNADLLKQTACNYINAFCPKLREKVIKENHSRLVYEFYNEGETIDESLMGITFDGSLISEKNLEDEKGLLKFLLPKA